MLEVMLMMVLECADSLRKEAELWCCGAAFLSIRWIVSLLRDGEGGDTSGGW